MKRRTAQVAFVFDYLYGKMTRYQSGHWGGGCDTCTTYDDGLNFVSDFQDRFPGRSPSEKNAAARLGRLCKQLFDDGWLTRGRLGNHDQYHPGQEPNWQYVYSVDPAFAEKIHSGKWNAEYMARRYEGDGDPWLALRTASAIEARSEGTGTGAAEGESAVAQPDAHTGPSS